MSGRCDNEDFVSGGLVGVFGLEGGDSVAKKVMGGSQTGEASTDDHDGMDCHGSL